MLRYLVVLMGVFLGAAVSTCPKGFKPDPRYPRNCIDIDECASNPPCQQLCRNSRGSYECYCRSGYLINERDPSKCDSPGGSSCQKGFQPDKWNPGSCVDIDECASNPPCQQLCRNSKGSYECYCRPGYLINERDPSKCDSPGGSSCQKGFKPDPRNPGSCVDIDECASNPPCQQLCRNSQGSYECYCRSGYLINERDPSICDIINNCPSGYTPNLSNPTDCLDIDECSDSPCEQICTNTKGSFTCSCGNGFVVDQNNKNRCRDVDECSGSNPCEQVCTNTAGAFVCSCRSGYTISATNINKCESVDKCRNNPCEQTCTSTSSGYHCSCNPGYTVNKSDPTKCTDVDECSDSPCEQTCTNTKGGYKCSCRDGFAVDPNNKNKCTDINECSDSPCEQTCTNTKGGYKCSCRDGFAVDPNNKNKCTAVDACSTGRRCEQICTSISTGRKCSCNPGYVINDEDPTTCDDINECSDSPCEHTCTNTIGSYKCSCRDGFVVDPNNKNKCTAVDACSTGRRCEQICTIISTGRKCSCKPGYVINDEDPTKCDEVEICKVKADVILVFDASASIGEEHYDKQFVFAKKLTSNFKLGASDVRFGGIVYSRFAQKLFDLKDHNTLETLHKGLSNVPYESSSTYTNEAFKLIDNQQLFSTSKGGRADAPDIVVLFTDGNPTKGIEDETYETAQVLKDKGVLILGVAIGTDLKLPVLQKITSSPDDALEATSYDTLEYIEKRLTQLLCQASKSSR